MQTTPTVSVAPVSPQQSPQDHHQALKDLAAHGYEGSGIRVLTPGPEKDAVDKHGEGFTSASGQSPTPSDGGVLKGNEPKDDTRQ